MELEQAQISWDENGLPHSTQFDDKYFCIENGLLESQYIFCEGNALQSRFENLSSEAPGIFIIVETGFGTGLNFCCAWQLWKQHAPQNWQLQYVSMDLYPLSQEQLKTSLALWPGITDFTQPLVKMYPSLINESRYELSFEKTRVKLVLLFDHVNDALSQLIEDKCVADAWFLDGFDPAKNPHMWSEDVFSRMAKMSNLQTTLSTFSVAGFVRRGLTAQGFTVEKIKGFGRKRHMLKGFYAKS